MEENETICDFEVGKDFLNKKQKALTINEKSDKFDNIENLNLCLANITIMKGKRQVHTGRKNT